MVTAIEKDLHMVNETLHIAKGGVIASGIASILLGILFLAQPLLAGLSLCFYVGVLFVVAGMAKMIFSFADAEGAGSSVLGGVILFLFGLICLTRPDVVASLLVIMAGFYIIADGANALSAGIAAVRAKSAGGILIIVCAVIFMICGFFVLFAPFSFVVVVSGVVMILEGIFSLVFVGLISNKINQA